MNYLSRSACVSEAGNDRRIFLLGVRSLQRMPSFLILSACRTALRWHSLSEPGIASDLGSSSRGWLLRHESSCSLGDRGDVRIVGAFR